MSDQADDLFQQKTGLAALIACVVRTLRESDHSFEARFLANLERTESALDERHPDRDMREARELLAWTRELLTGWNQATGQGHPLFGD